MTTQTAQTTQSTTPATRTALATGREDIAVAASTRRRFAFGLIPAAFAVLAAGTAAPQLAAADSRSRKKRKDRRPQRPIRRPGEGPIVTPPPVPGQDPAAATLTASYVMGTLGTLTVTGERFDPNHEVTLSVKMDWSPTLECYMVQFSTTVTADALGAFTWSGNGYCPRTIDVYADQGDIHAHAHVEDFTCPW